MLVGKSKVKFSSRCVRVDWRRKTSWMTLGEVFIYSDLSRRRRRGRKKRISLLSKAESCCIKTAEWQEQEILAHVWLIVSSLSIVPLHKASRSMGKHDKIVQWSRWTASASRLSLSNGYEQNTDGYLNESRLCDFCFRCSRIARKCLMSKVLFFAKISTFYFCYGDASTKTFNPQEEDSAVHRSERYR